MEPPGTAPSAGASPTATRPTMAQAGISRPARLVEREAPYVLAELRRVALVTGTCLGLLGLLVVIDRLQ